MRDYNDFAIFLVASWKLTQDGRIPATSGILDWALEAVSEAIPAKFKGLLHFGNTRVGRRCFELEKVLYLARDNELLTDPNPRYKTAEITISRDAARRWIKRLGLTQKDAERFGNALKQRVEEAARTAA